MSEPGDTAARNAGGVPVALVRDRTGVLRAFLNVCRHRGCEVVSGAGNRRTLQCPYHAWTYDLDGALVSAPRSDHEARLDPADVALVPLRMERWGPLIFVDPSGAAAPLAATLEHVPSALAAGGVDVQELVWRRRTDYSVEANWKVVIENFLECYHCPVAHHDFSRVMDVRPESYELVPGVKTSSQYAQRRTGGQVAGDGVAAAQFHFVWPNVRLNVFAGAPNLSVGVAWPATTGRTYGFFDYFFAPGVPADEIDELIEFDEQVGREDRALVESVQRGAASGFLPGGRLLPKSERLIAHFDGLVRTALAD